MFTLKNCKGILQFMLLLAWKMYGGDAVYMVHKKKWRKRVLRIVNPFICVGLHIGEGTKI